MRFQLRFVVLATLVVCCGLVMRTEAAEDKALTMVVMDPLAAPLSCPCVEGYAQRKYEHLETYLEAKLDRSINLLFVESLEALKPEDLVGGTVDLIIGKDSVVRFDAQKRDLKPTPLGRMTDKDGSTTQYGLIVVPKEDPAQKPADLQGYQIYFGAIDAQEKHQAAIELLTNAGVKLPDSLQISQACSDGACKILESKDEIQGAAVISSYAAPLLEGCGTIKKGDLRVIGQTKKVPFITAFATHHVSSDEQQRLKHALLDMVTEPDLCVHLETLVGFVPVESPEDGTVKKK